MRISDWSSDVCSSDLQCPDADQQLAGRSADLVAERPRHPVFPHDARTRRQVEPVAGRPDRGEPAPPADAAGRIGSELGSGPALSGTEPKRPARVQISRPAGYFCPQTDFPTTTRGQKTRTKEHTSE